MIDEDKIQKLEKIIAELEKEKDELKKSAMMPNIYLQNVIENMPGSIYLKDKDGRFLACNQFVAEMAGVSSPNEIIGKNDYELVWSSIADNIRKNDVEIMTSKQEKEFEEEVILPGSVKMTMLTHKAPLFDENGYVIGIIGVSIDISSRLEAERLKLEKAVIEKHSEHIKAAAGSIAHDLRTPLSSINAALSGIEKYFPSLLAAYTAAKSNQLDVPNIRNSTLNALQRCVETSKKEILFSNSYIDLVLGNLKYDNIDTSNYTVCNMSEVIDDAINAYPFKDTERLLVELNLEDNFNFYGNNLYLKNVINNLIKNALYFIAKSQKGNIQIKLDSASSNFNKLIFKDTALGAPPSVLKKMFESYYSKREGGTGLGLSFCKTIMQSFKGDITAESTEGEYMLFTLLFPKVSN